MILRSLTNMSLN